MKPTDRIWAVFDKHEQGGLPRVYATAEKTKGTEYIRADQVKELTDRLETAYRVKAECNDDANRERRRATTAEAALAAEVVKPRVKPLTYDEVEKVIKATECAELSDRGDQIWTRRQAVALADLFNARLSALQEGE
jgi:hypothetical protein